MRAIAAVAMRISPPADSLARSLCSNDEGCDERAIRKLQHKLLSLRCHKARRTQHTTGRGLSKTHRRNVHPNWLSVRFRQNLPLSYSFFAAAFSFHAPPRSC